MYVIVFTVIDIILPVWSSAGLTELKAQSVLTVTVMECLYLINYLQAYVFD